MTKSIAKRDSNLPEAEQFTALVDEIEAINVNYKTVGMLETIRRNLQIGSAIRGSPLYSKSAKGNRDLISRLSVGTGLRERTVYSCVRLHEEFGGEKSLEKSVEAIYKRFGSSRKAMAYLTEGDSQRDSNNSGPSCKKCPIHCV